jgi:hypothetical protein
LEKFDNRLDGIQISRFDRQHLSGFTGQFLVVRSYLFKYVLEPRPAKESEHHFDSEIGLKCLNPATTEESGEIGSGWVGSIKLSEWRNEEQNAWTSHGLDIPYCLNGMLRDEVFCRRVWG